MQKLSFYFWRSLYSAKHFLLTSFNRKYRFNRTMLNPARRTQGISGFMRLRNEQDFVAQVIEAYLPFLDELIIVYSRCTDNTPLIVEEQRKRYPDKIKVYEYKPYVYPPRSKGHFYLPVSSPHSLVNYCNYALSKTTRKVAIKIDGDEFPIPHFFEEEVENIRKNGLYDFSTYYSINLWDENGEIYVNRRRPFKRETHGFFPVSENSFFIHYTTWEEFNCNRADCKTGKILFFHLKGMKKDRGIGNSGDRKHFLFKPYLSNPGLMSWTEFKKAYNIDDAIPAPERLGIKPIR